MAKKTLLSKTVEKFPGITKYISPRLRSVYVELTNYCNLNCRMCFSRERPRGYMDLRLFRKIIEELQEMDIQSLALHYGGESLLHPNFVEMLDYVALKRRKYRLGFSTNGMLLTEEISDQLVKCRVDWINISLEGFAKTNDFIRLGCSYDVVEKNINILLEKRKTYNKPVVSINMTYINQSFDEINAFVKYCIEKVEFISLNPCLTEELKIVDLNSYYEIVEKFCGYDKGIKERSFCRSPFGVIAILWDGTVTACCHDLKGLNRLGNVNEEGIKQIWKGSNFKRLRFSCIKHNFDPEHICYNCEAWKPYFQSYHKIINGMEVTTKGLAIVFRKNVLKN